MAFGGVSKGIVVVDGVSAEEGGEGMFFVLDVVVAVVVGSSS